MDRTGLSHRNVELLEPDGGEFAEKTCEISEVMGRRSMRHAGLTRHCPQRQSRQPIAFKHPFGRLQQGVAQRAMMIRRILGAASAPGRGRFA
jgi:hypothetical protein